MKKLLVLLLPLLWLTDIYAEQGKASHVFSTYTTYKYPADFKHFDYANPEAPKGGTLHLAAIGTFDSINPFIIKGTPSGYVLITLASLMTESKDEVSVAYSYIAEKIDIADDKKSVTFTVRNGAKFNNGEPVTADDIIFSFNILMDKGIPLFRNYYKDVESVEKIDDSTVTFVFKTAKNKELPLILAQLNVLSKKYYDTHTFNESTLEPYPVSGPYEIDSVDPGRSITFKRVKNWWGDTVPSQVGSHNFEKIKVDYYLDRNAMFVAFKAGKVDFRIEATAKTWETGYNFPAVKDGRVIMEEIEHGMVAGSYGLFFNTRREIFKDRLVRKALTLAFDFGWINRNIFHDNYKRNNSYFPNSDLAQCGVPTGETLEILLPHQEQLPPDLFNVPFELPIAKNQQEIREYLKQAQVLLEKSGWDIVDQRLANKKGEPFTFEILLFEQSLSRVVLNFVNALDRLGISVNVRYVDSTTYQERVESLDYDMIMGVIPQSQGPGNEQIAFWGSQQADVKGSRNFSGIKNPAIDAIASRIVSAETYESMVNHVRALDLALLWNYYMIPAWHSGKARVAYWNRFGHPKTAPKYNPIAYLTWWIDPKKEGKIKQWYHEEADIALKEIGADQGSKEADNKNSTLPRLLAQLQNWFTNLFS